MDSRILIFITTTLAIMASLVIGAAVGSGEYLFPVLAVLAILGVLFIAQPPITVFLTVALFSSQLNAPGLPGQFGLYEIASLSVLFAAIVGVVFTRKVPLKLGFAHKLLVAFCLLLLAIGYYRGFGIRFLGSDLWGGYAYVKILLAATLVFILPLVNMPPGWWRPAVILMGVLSIIPVFADLLTLYGFRLPMINLFVKATGIASNDFLEEQTGMDVDRLLSAGASAQTMTIAFLAVVHSRKIFNPRTPWAIGLLLCVIALSFVSGFRLMTATIILITFIVILLQRTLTPGRVAFGVIGSLAGLALIYHIADILPTNMQRTISWLPGIEIAQAASIDASATVSWRLDLWHEAAKDIPQYLWVGRGLAFSGEQLIRSMTDPYSIDWAMIVGVFHNGYLSLLILTGAPGFALGVSLMIAIVWRHWRIDRLSWSNPRLQLIHQAFLANIAALTIIFLTVYGDIATVFPPFFFFWAIMEAVRKADDGQPPLYVGDREIAIPSDYAHLE